MEQYINFVINHWVLWLLFFIILGLLIWFEIYSRVAGFVKLPPQEVVNKINHENAVVIDLRDSKAFANGRILGAINQPFPELSSEAVQKKIKKYKNKNVILLASSEAQAVKAGAYFAQQGFDKIFIMQGGIQAWLKANLPLVSSKTS